jgi:hypothetical protein
MQGTGAPYSVRIKGENINHGSVPTWHTTNPQHVASAQGDDDGLLGLRVMMMGISTHKSVLCKGMAQQFMQQRNTNLDNLHTGNTCRKCIGCSLFAVLSSD